VSGWDRHRAPSRGKIHISVGPDIGNTARAVEVPDDEVGSPRSGYGGRRVNLEFGTGAREGLADKGTYLTLDQIEHHATDALIGIVNMLGHLDAAVLADGQNAVIVQERFGTRFLVRLDHILEQHAVLDLDGNGLLEIRMGDGHLPFHSRKDADINLFFWSIRAGDSRHKEQRCASSYNDMAGLGGHRRLFRRHYCTLKFEKL